MHSPFIWDDPYLITDNHYVKSFSYISEIFKHHLYYSTAGLSNFYRPLQSLLLMVDYSLWKTNPFGYHLTSLFCHIICAFLVFLVIDSIFKRRFIALMVGLLFLIHPINSTVVDYISSRADSQATLFILLSFWLFFKYIYLSKNSIPSRLYYIGSLTSFVLALLSKELSIILPLLILVSLAIIYNEGRFPRSLAYRKTVPFFIILGFYALLRLTILNFASPTSVSFPSLYIRLLTSTQSFVRLMWLIFLPVEIHIEKSIPYANSLFEPRIFASVATLIGVGMFLSWIRRYSKICFFGFIWFFVSLLPMANIVPINATMADHWLYLPCIGFFLAIVGGCGDLIKWLNLKSRRLTGGFAPCLYGLYGLAIIVLSVMTIRQNTIWREPLKFYQKALRHSPDSFRAHNEMGVIYLNQSTYDKAISEFQKAIRNNPRFDQAYDNLGVAYDMKGDFDNAILQHKKALELNPNNAKIYNNLGNAYIKLNRFDDAINVYNEALRLNPDYKAVYNNLGVVYYKKGMYEEAIRQWEKVLKIDPHFKMAADNIKVVQEELRKR